MATAHSEGMVRLWDPATGRPVGKPIPADTGPGGSVIQVAFSPDGKLLAIVGTGHYGDTVRLWDPATGRPAGTQLSTAGDSVDQVAFSPSGKLLASLDDDGAVRLWDPVTGQLLGGPLPSGAGVRVDSVAFSPDSALLATADSNGTVQLRNVSPFMNPYEALCADVGPPTKQAWDQYAHGEPYPKACA